MMETLKKEHQADRERTLDMVQDMIKTDPERAMRRMETFQGREEAHILRLQELNRDLELMGWMLED